MFHIVEVLLNNDIFLFILCYLLIVVPIMGIMIVHKDIE